MPILASRSLHTESTLVSDPATIAWVAAVVANGGSVSDARKTIVNTLIVGLKSDGVWTKLDRLWLFAAENTGSALTDLVGLTLATATNSPSFTTDVGYTGNDTDAYVDSNFNPATAPSPKYVQDSATYFIWNNTDGDSSKVFGGNLQASVNLYTYIARDSGLFYAAINDSNANAFTFSASNPSALGLFSGNRSASNASQSYFNGAQVATSTNASKAMESSNMAFIAAFNNRSARQCCGGGFGQSLTSTEQGDLYDRLRTYMTAVGVP